MSSNGLTSTAAGASVGCLVGAMRPLPLTTTTGMALKLGLAEHGRAQLPAVHHRHHEVEHDHARSRAAVQARERLFAVGRFVDREAFDAEDRRQIGANVVIVLDDQHPTRHMLPAMRHSPSCMHPVAIIARRRAPAETGR